MPEFKNREEYNKWKTEQKEQTQQNQDKPQEIKKLTRGGSEALIQKINLQKRN